MPETRSEDECAHPGLCRPTVKTSELQGLLFSSVHDFSGPLVGLTAISLAYLLILSPWTRLGSRIQGVVLRVRIKQMLGGRISLDFALLEISRWLLYSLEKNDPKAVINRMLLQGLMTKQTT